MLSGADLRAAFLALASCRATDFRNARLANATIGRTNCTGADFRGATFESNGHLSDSDLTSANAEGVDFSDCYLTGTVFRDAELAGARFREAILDGADFRGASLKGADFAEASLRKADLSECVLRSATLFRCNFLGATLARTHLQEADLREAQFEGAMLEGAYLGGAWMERAQLRGAKLKGAFLDATNLTQAVLEGADLREAFLDHANLTETNLQRADLTGVHLERAILVKTNLAGAVLTGARVYGIAAWDLVLGDDDTQSRDLVITPQGQPSIVVDHIDIAQFTYLLLHNPNIRRVIDTVGRRGVLILGRFTPERKQVLEAIRAELRRRGLIPILFDFDRPVDRSVRETVLTLASLSLFIIADLTSPSSIPLELGEVIPTFEIPVAPIIAEGEKPFAMFVDLYNQFKRERGGHLLEVLSYQSIPVLTSHLNERIIEPAKDLANELAARKAKAIAIKPIG